MIKLDKNYIYRLSIKLKEHRIILITCLLKYKKFNSQKLLYECNIKSKN